MTDISDNIIVGATFDDTLEGIVRVSVVATGIDNTGVARPLQQQEGALANFAEKLRQDSRRFADRTQQATPITPSLLGPAQAEASMASTAPERLRTPRVPRVDELTQNEIRAAQHKARDNSHPEKRGTTLMQRLASVGLSRRVEKDEPNGACNSIGEDVLDTPAFLRRRATT